MTDRTKIVLVRHVGLFFCGSLLVLIVLGSLLRNVWFFGIWLTLTLTWVGAVGQAARNYPHLFLKEDPTRGTTITLRKVDDATRAQYVAAHDNEFAEIHGWHDSAHQRFLKQAKQQHLTPRIATPAP